MTIAASMTKPLSDPADRAADDGAVTARLAGWLVAAAPADLPAPVWREAKRSFLNWLGCAVGGARHEAVEAALAALSPFAGRGESAILGRADRLDPLNASLINGISSHVFDFDDTHLRTVIHPAGPVASALLAFAGHRRISGRDFLQALTLGVEVECRIGNAVFPAHYDIGWHITGTAGVFGAAAAIGKILGLDEERMAWALGLAASQPVGLREMFGSMTKSFHPGRAAQNGMTAALLAEKGYTSSKQALEAKRGWANVLSASHDFSEITDGLGARFEILTNTYKPFACGIVIHPAIDGCVQLRERGIDPSAIEALHLTVHPLVLELTGKTEPQTGLESKFSVYHAAAIALLEGKGGEAQFSDRAARDPEVIGLRRRISAAADPALAPDEVRLSLRLRDGQTIDLHVPHAIGSLARPMTDADLAAKFHDLADPVVGQQRAGKLIDLCRDIEALKDVSAIAEASRMAS